MKKLSNKTIIKRIKDGKRCCPVCGSYRYSSTGNMVEYPERWEEQRCVNCGQLVCISDNSPYIHICEDILDTFKHLSYSKIQNWIRTDPYFWGRK